MTDTKIDHTEPLFDDQWLNVYAARAHNLKAIDVAIPRNKLVVITGISGSGKSSLAFDTIYAEGQRRYMESFSAYARQFLGEMERPEVDKITGLSPVISIEQKTTNKNPRSTVGTVTELYDFFRLLYARAADAYSSTTGQKMEKFSEDQILEIIENSFLGKRIMILASVVKGRKGHYREIFEEVRKKGYLKVRVDGEVMDIADKMQLDRYKIHDIEVVVDRLELDEESLPRLKKSVQTALKMGKGQLLVLQPDTQQLSQYSKTLVDPETGLAFEDPSPNSFSFNSPYGACPQCKGLGQVYQIDPESLVPNWEVSIADGGIAPLGELRENTLFTQIKNLARKSGFSLNAPLKDIPKAPLNLILFGNTEGEVEDNSEVLDSDRWYTLEYGGISGMILRSYADTGTSDHMRRWAEEFVQSSDCPDCNGYRLKNSSLQFKIDTKHIGQITRYSLVEMEQWMQGLEQRITDRQNVIGKEVLKEIRLRLGFLLDVGLGYLSMDRQTKSLSGGEAQRVRLATQIGSMLTGVTYILDEPTIGLHQRDNLRLISALKALRDAGNSVLVVEHDKDLMLASDFIIDIGPKAGVHGGEIVGQGTPAEFLAQNTLTGGYLSGSICIPVPAERRKGNGHVLHIQGASGHNLLGVDIVLPLGKLICVTGVSGSGKSSLINETLYPILQNHFYRTKKVVLPYTHISGIEQLDKVIEIDQTPIGRTPRSNAATYTEVFTHIRQLFAEVPEAKIRGYKPGRFSFNVKGGRCPTCEGDGMRTIEMNFLPDVYVHCETCQGKRYNRETLEILYKGKSIYDVLEMTVEDAVVFFEHLPRIYQKMITLHEVGLDYIKLGQPSTTLSGGEAQRVKLATELSKKDTGKTLYILDEPTTGLHFEDIRVLMTVLNRLVEKGNTMVVIEHNLDVIKLADYIIDMGPEGGTGGGKVVACGTPEQVAANPNSITGKFLITELEAAHVAAVG